MNDDFEARVRGEITPAEYVKRIDERLAARVQSSQPSSSTVPCMYRPEEAHMWIILRWRAFGPEADQIETLQPVGPFDSEAAAASYLEAHTYSLAENDEYWRPADDHYGSAQVFEAVAPDD